MKSLWSLMSLVHLLGLALALGAATVKFTLLLKCRSDPGFAAVYLKVVRPITRLIILGLVLLTLSGIVWITLGFPLKPLLWVKIALVAAVWVIGPVIDKLVEPGFVDLLPAPGQTPTAAFQQVQSQYLALEGLATGLFYVIAVLGWRV